MADESGALSRESARGLGALPHQSALRPGDLIGGAHTPDLRRVERAIVRGLAQEFGKGQQCQVTHADRFSIAIAGTRVVVEVVEHAE